MWAPVHKLVCAYLCVSRYVCVVALVLVRCATAKTPARNKTLRIARRTASRMQPSRRNEITDQINQDLSHHQGKACVARHGSMNEAGTCTCRQFRTVWFLSGLEKKTRPACDRHEVAQQHELAQLHSPEYRVQADMCRLLVSLGARVGASSHADGDTPLHRYDHACMRVYAC
jgi:hypothetical protein